MSRPKWIVGELAPGAAASTATAGGDVTGTLPGGLVVTGIEGFPIDLTGIAGGDVITWDAVNSKWVVTVPAPVTGFELNHGGGQDTIKAHGSLGAAATVDPADGNVHTGTLNANCTVTLTAPVGSGACTLELWLTEDGTGGRTVTWPGSVTEQGTHTMTASTTSRVILETVDGGTSWVATWVGSGTSFAVPSIAYGTPAAGAATTAIRSDATIAKPTEADLSLSNVTTGNASTSKHGFAPILPNDPTKYYDGTGAFSVPPGSGGTGIWRPLMDGAGNVITDGATGEAVMALS